VQKGEPIDLELGQWKGINEFIEARSNQNIERVSMYSLTVDPMTSCGCFEAIVGIVPECNGVMIVNREHTGMTPCGMTFPELAGTISGGVQVEGFMGIGKAYISSRKFLSANGGIRRVVWMPKWLKEQIEPDFRATSEALGVPDLLDRIGDETITVDPMELAEHLAAVQHEALQMESII
jgi:acetyl-CoA synthase